MGQILLQADDGDFVMPVDCADFFDQCGKLPRTRVFLRELGNAADVVQSVAGGEVGKGVVEGDEVFVGQGVGDAAEFGVEGIGSVCSYIATMTPKSNSSCACPDCKCEVTPGHHVAKDGKDFCSEACASGHANGDGCCNHTCSCHG